MKKKSIKLIAVLCILLSATFLTACGNENSKVDQVIQNQIQGGETKPDRNAGEGVVETATKSATYMPEIKNQETGKSKKKEPKIDVDLTKLSSTMVYSEVYNMMFSPDDYVGERIKMRGIFDAYANPDTAEVYFACIISDAMACCSQGIEFQLAGEHKYPEDYPKPGEEITVTGVFDTFYEDDYLYCILRESKLE